ncbi:hypothetical protein BGP_2711 [Beggiatoa sp. PS]|nr:hypothetical protein BGP_2711 [Beggiatoa sp. PS]
MTYQLNITQNHFDFIDFSEASAFINVMPELSTTVELYFWGITLLTSSTWGKPLILPNIDINSDDDIYISGHAKAVFQQVIGGEIQIELYDPQNLKTFLKNQQGESVTLQKRWTFKPNHSMFVYELDCVSEWPAGACYLALASKGQAQLTFEVSDCINAQQFVLSPKKYSQPAWKRAKNVHDEIVEIS